MRRMPTILPASLLIWSLAMPPADAQVQKPLNEQQLAAQGARKLTGPELRRLLSGNTAVGITLPTGLSHTTWYRDEKHRIVSLGSTKVTRLWWLERDTLCHERADRDAHTCYRFYETGGQFQSCGDDSKTCDNVVRVLPGNPTGL